MKYDIKPIGEKALKLLNIVSECTPLNAWLDGEIDEYEWVEYFDAVPDHIHYATGVTRVVFWDEYDCNFVYKLELSDDYDCCSNEAYVYEEAEEDGIEECFAWTAKVCEWYNRAVYAMEYCEVDHYENSEASYKYHREVICEDNGWDINNLTDEQQSELINSESYDWTDHEGMIEYARKFYSQDVYESLVSFIWELNITDLHSGNWGYRAGRLVLTDYGGYTSPIARR